MSKLNIKTEFVNPPIPDRSHDWAAWYDEYEEEGCGFGKTEEEAIEDLKMNIEIKE